MEGNYQWYFLGSNLFNIIIGNLGAETRCVLIKFVDSTELEGITNAKEDYIVMQEDLWSIGNNLKSKVMQLRTNNKDFGYKMGAHGLEASEKEWDQKYRLAIE